MEWQYYVIFLTAARVQLVEPQSSSNVSSVPAVNTTLSGTFSTYSVSDSSLTSSTPSISEFRIGSTADSSLINTTSSSRDSTSSTTSSPITEASSHLPSTLLTTNSSLTNASIDLFTNDFTSPSTNLFTNPSINLSSVCLQPHIRGPCDGSITRYFYDSVTGVCDEFFYGGCGGNENNFFTRSECMERCGGTENSTMEDSFTTTETTECPSVEVIPPPGCQVVPSSTSASECPVPEIKCVEGPCSGNPCPNSCDNCINEPKTCITTPCLQYRCESSSNCSGSEFPPFPSPFITVSSTTSRSCGVVVCSSGTVCREFEGNPSCVFDPLVNTSDRVRNVCQSEPDTGRCKASFPRWFFNNRSSQCEQFIYGGCDGNENNFDTRQSCELFCASFMTISQPGQCPSSDQMHGPCDTECRKDGDCPKDAKCCPTACRGSVCVHGTSWKNGFGLTSSHRPPPNSEAKTQPQSFLKPSHCPSTRLSTGTCGFSCGTDVDCEGDQKCCPTSCGGTVCIEPSNRMASRQSPQSGSVTLDTKRMCRQVADSGKCTGSVTRWYFDAVLGKCESFLFSGCAGNSNNFGTHQQCEETCGSVPPCPQFTPSAPIPGCTTVSWFGVEGCPVISFKCTGGECAGKSCPGPCEYCVNEPKQCLAAPCLQYQCKANETCLHNQCSSLTCGDGFSCTVVNGSISCAIDGAQSSRCLQPMDRGHCLAVLVQYYYNSTNRRCDPFLYGGCAGNSNRFNSLEECQSNCVLSSG